jgi:Bacterial Ig domain/Dockerin type I domain
LLASDLQNPSNPFDVDNDLDISPIDALKVINDIRRYGKSIDVSGNIKNFTNVDGDAERTPLDALIVMNAIRRRTPDVTFKLTNDTDRHGGTAEDRRTYDLGVVGRLHFQGQTHLLNVTAESGEQATWIDVSSHVTKEGHFEFDDESIRSILGSQVKQGSQQIRFRSGPARGYARQMELEVLAAPPLPRLVASEINEDQEIHLDIVGEAYDPDSPIASLKLTIHEQPKSGTLTPSGQAFVYRPDDNYFGEDFIVYEIEDENDTSGMVTLAVSIAAVNDPPVLTSVPDVEFRMSDGILEIPYNPVDEEGEPLDLIAFATVPNPLVEIRDAYGLFGVGDDYFDLTGLKEKWLFGKDETSFFILPDGDFIQWGGSYADTAKRETLVARLDPSVYEDPSQLFDPAPAVLAPVIVLVCTLGDRISPTD